MAIQRSVAVRNAQLDAIETAVGTAPTLTLRTGTPPASCAAARTGTVLATIALPSDWLAAASGGVKSMAGGPWSDPSCDASGIASHYSIDQGATCHEQGLVSEPWQGSKLYGVGHQVHNGGNVYRATASGTSAASGGPSGTGGSITDGGVTWAWVQAGTDLAHQNVTIVAGQPTQIDAYSLTAGGA